MIEPRLKEKIACTLTQYEQKCDKLQGEIDGLKSTFHQLDSSPGFYNELDECLNQFQQELEATETAAQLTIDPRINAHFGKLIETLLVPSVLSDKVENFKNLIKVPLTNQSLIEAIDTLAGLLVESQKITTHKSIITDLPNKVAYDEHILRAFHRWQRGFGDLILAVASVDQFKKMKENYGQETTENVLKEIATIFRKSVRAVDYVAHYNEDSFVFVLERTHLIDATAVVDNLSALIEENPFTSYGEPITVSVSFGLTVLTREDNLDRLFERANYALYEAMQVGKSQVMSL